MNLYFRNIQINIIEGIAVFLVFFIIASGCEKHERVVAVKTFKEYEVKDSLCYVRGNIVDLGEAGIDQHGFMWSSLEEHGLNVINLGSAESTGVFGDTLTGLKPSTKYYFKAFATNSEGTSYGGEESFKTAAGSVTDSDGNTYNTVEIGTQLWMAENLRTTKYNDGTNIPLVTDNTEWSNLTTPAYCDYDSEILAKKANYGALYNWYTVNTNKLCPSGWHVSTDEDWKILEMYLGMTQAEAEAEGFRGTNVGSKLAGNADLWNNGDLEANSDFGSSGFTAFPAGYRVIDGYFDSRGNRTYFWSSTAYSSDGAWVRRLNFDTDRVYRGDGDNRYGLSVRCVKD